MHDNSEVVLNCHMKLDQLAENHSITLRWMSSHSEICGKELADELVFNSSTGPEPTCVGCIKAQLFWGREGGRTQIRATNYLLTHAILSTSANESERSKTTSGCNRSHCGSTKKQTGQNYLMRLSRIKRFLSENLDQETKRVKNYFKPTNLAIKGVIA